jgi:response regulator of citrate/malate metabolism
MNKKVLVIQGKHSLVMETIAKLIKVNFNCSSRLSELDDVYENINELSPKLIFVDKTILSENPLNIISKLHSRFVDALIIIVSLDDEKKLVEQFNTWNRIEIINLWSNNSILNIISSAFIKADNLQSDVA